MENGWRVRWCNVMVMMMPRQIGVWAVMQVAQPRCQSTANRSNARRRHQIWNRWWDADCRSIVKVVMMVVVMQVIVWVGLTCRYVAVGSVVVCAARAHQVLKTQAGRVRHLVQSASIHHWQRIEWWKDLLVWSNVNCFKSVLDTFAAEFRCSRHFLQDKKKYEIISRDSRKFQTNNFINPDKNKSTKTEFSQKIFQSEIWCTFKTLIMKISSSEAELSDDNPR